MQEENTTNTKKIIAVSSVLLLILILVPVTFYLYINTSKHERNEISNTANENIIQKDNVKLKSATDLSSQENISNYLEGVNGELSSENIENHQRDILLLRKALILSENRFEDRSKRTNEATDILVDLINRNQGKDATSTYIRNFATISLIRTHNLCCGDANNDNYLFEVKIDGYDSKYSEYIKGGYSKGLSKFLALNDLMNTVSPFYRNDSVNKKNQLHNVTRILSMYSKELKPEMKSEFVGELKTYLDQSSNTKAITFTDAASLHDVKYAYAFAYDVYNQVTNNLTPEINKKIDEKYEEINSVTIENTPGIDPIGLNEVKFYSEITYFKSINDRYGKKVDMMKYNSLIDDILKIINSSKELRTVAYNVFHSEEFKNGEYANSIYFASQRDKNKKIDDYLKSIGI